MLRLFTCLSAVLVLFSNVSFAQNCPTNPTYLNKNGTYELSAGRSLAINDGAPHTVTIEHNFSATSTICVTNGSTLNLTFNTMNNPPAGGTIYLDATSKLVLKGTAITNFPFTLNNYGTFTQNIDLVFTTGAAINNHGTYTTAKSIIVNGGAVTISNDGTMTLSGAVTFNSTALTVNNQKNGTLTIKKAVVFNSGKLNNDGTLNFDASTTGNSLDFHNTGYANFGDTYILDNGSVTNYGIFDAKGDITINNGVTVTNYCTITGDKNFTFNGGTLTNYGKILLPTTGASSFVIQANFINGPNGFVQGMNFTNNNTITGGGNFYFKGNTNNNGTFSGTATSNINFYDASNNTNKVFDIQNREPQFATKNAITPVSTTGFTACGAPAAPAITVHPASVNLCSSSITSATFSVVASSQYSPITYQWKKNGTNIQGATSSSYIANNLILADTANVYTVAVTNSTGTTVSGGASVKYIIVAQPTPTTAYLATGNSTTFKATASSVASAFQWKKDGTDISGATAVSYKINTVETTSAGKYTLTVSYPGGTCTSNAAILTTSTILYSKASGDMNANTTWGVNTDGSGSTPVNFSRDEHTFVVANRNTITNSANLTIAGKLDIKNGIVIITPGTILTAGRIVRSGTTGTIAGSATSSLSMPGISLIANAGPSDLYFKADANVLQNLTIAGHAVTLRNALNLTAGSNPGKLTVNSGSFNTSDSLTLKSDALGTAIVGISAGTITGKATVERYIPARRAWRVMCAPVTSVDAPTINAAWQEGSIASTDNPHPGYGTHITYGNTADGFDQNPQKTFSLYYYNTGKWYGIPATNKTPVTQYATYLFFIRGNRSYDITSTTNTTTPTSTILRTTGYLKQGQQPDIQANATEFTPVANPYASPVNFERIYNNSSNIKNTIRVWDPSLAGAKGVGAYVTLDWTGSGYKATPPSAMTNIIQPYQAFFVQTVGGTAGKVSINEAAKNVTTVTNPFGRSVTNANRLGADAMLEINLRVINEDSTTGIADGVLYRFNEEYSDAIDDNDINKFNNLYENISIQSNNTLLTIERRREPQANDTLHLYLSGTKTTNYQLEIVPQAISKNMFLYDNYLKTLSPINPTDTNRFTISINTADALSKATNRFSIVTQQLVLPVTFTSAKAYAKDKTVQVEWKVATEINVDHYEVERSANGTAFIKAGSVNATGAVNYSFNDATPLDGNSYYRVKSVDKNGKLTYTDILPVTINTSNSTASSLSIYPNPIKGRSFQVQLNNKPAGTYTLALFSSSSQQLFTQTINYNGGTAIFNVRLNNTLASGMYFITATAADGSKETIKVVAE